MSNHLTDTPPGLLPINWENVSNDSLDIINASVQMDVFAEQGKDSVLYEVLNEPVVTNRFDSLLDIEASDTPMYQRESTGSKIKKKLLPTGWGIKSGNITTPSGFSFGKSGIGWTTDF